MNSIEWLNSLRKDAIITAIQVNNKEFHRINTEAKFVVPDNLLTTLKREYDPAQEKGGMILFKPSKEFGIPVFTASEIIFIENKSEEPWRSYRIDHQENKKFTLTAFQQGLIPFRFHTHPTKSNNFLQEFYRYLSNLETSDADQMCSLTGLQIGDLNLRLPDILIVGNGSQCMDVFIGFYNGLICPTSFKGHKEELTGKARQKANEFVDENSDKNAFWIILGVVVVAGIVLAVKYPKAILPLLIGAVVVVPQLIYSTQSKNEFFGISKGDNLEIWIPKIDDEVILANEIEATKKLEKWHDDIKTKDSEKRERVLQAID